MLDYDRYWDQIRRDKALMDDLEATHAKLDEATAERDAAIEKLRQDKLDTARKLNTMNLATEQIAAAIGLAAAEIASL